MYPYQRLLEEGYQVDIAAPTTKKLQFVVHDFEDGYDTYTEKPGYTWAATSPSRRSTRPTMLRWSSPAAGRRSTSATTLTCSASCGTLWKRQAGRPDVSCTPGARCGRTLKGRRTAAYPALASDVERPGRSSLTRPRWSTGSWSRPGRGRTIQPGCASSSESCARSRLRNAGQPRGRVMETKLGVVPARSVTSTPPRTAGPGRPVSPSTTTLRPNQNMRVGTADPPATMHGGDRRGRRTLRQ